MKRESISIRVIIIGIFILLMLTTVGVIGYIIFSNWLSSVDKMIIEMADDMNDEIHHEIDTFIQMPEHINTVNQELIENGIVDMYNEIDRERFFVGVLRSHISDLYSFSFGTETGEYYGARRNEDNIIEIMRNNSDTGGHSWYYSITEELIAGERVKEAGKFDPRTREWYKVAKETQKLVFSPVYKHFVMNDLTISAAVPIYSKDGVLKGVLGSHIILSRIDRYLNEIVKGKNAIAVIIEKDSGELIANSLELTNFTTLKDGSIKRRAIHEVNNQAILEAYKSYESTGKRDFKVKYNDDHIFINFIEYQKRGLEWIVITAVPASIFSAGVKDSIMMTVLLTLLALILSIIVYLTLTNKFLRPIDILIEITEKFSLGDLSQRAVVIRNDEIGKISKSFNKMANTISMLVNNLEAKVKDRTAKLEESNNKLQESKEQLQLILDSTVEAIYGMDIKGKCIFCNLSGLVMLGYSNQEELLGKDIHLQIHHTYKDGTSMPIDKCKIYEALLEGKGTFADDEVFWRADGSSFNVEYHSYPQYKNGEVIGAVVTFIDNTERKMNEERIKYLSYHDSLTKLYNRMFFEDELKRLDNNENLPLSIIYGDVNGLKLTNDIFGHSAGDELLIKLAAILRKVCTARDIIARVGGDEFAIILPNTPASEAENIVNRVKTEFSKEQVVAIKGSISMGFDTKIIPQQDTYSILKNAEERMYKDKTLNRKVINSDMVKTIIETLHKKSHREKSHSAIVSELCQDIARELNMSEMEVRQLKDAGFLHDIGKIVVDDRILTKVGSLTEEEWKEMQQHAMVGYRILNLFDETMDLAEGILNHHENWNGTGYPKGLKGQQIPKLARIIKVAESYDSMTNSLNINRITKEAAINEIVSQSGIKYDPDIVDVFKNLIYDSLR